MYVFNNVRNIRRFDARECVKSIEKKILGSEDKKIVSVKKI
jgi:hypothetical protein